MKKSPIASFDVGFAPGTRTTSARLSERVRRQAIKVAEVAATSGRVRIENNTATVEVPAQLAAILRVVAEAAAAGETITLLVGDEELTSQQVADILNVSRPYVVKLARDGALPFKMVGNRHRFSAVDVAKYQREEAQRRDRVLSRIAHTEEYAIEDF
jgi:excisionase family DNA binding protein